MKENGSRTDETRGEPFRTSDDRFYRALASRERRRLLYVLLHGEERSVEETATVLLGWDVTESEGVGDPDER